MKHQRLILLFVCLFSHQPALDLLVDFEQPLAVGSLKLKNHIFLKHKAEHVSTTNNTIMLLSTLTTVTALPIIVS